MLRFIIIKCYLNLSLIQGDQKIAATSATYAIQTLKQQRKNATMKGIAKILKAKMGTLQIKKTK